MAKSKVETNGGLSKKESSALVAMDVDSWGDSSLTTDDLVVPRVLAMNHMSDLVKQKKADFGEFRDSLEGSLLGSLEKPMLFVPFHLEKVWFEYEIVKGKRQYSSQFAVTAANEKLAWRDEEAGVERDKVYNFYVLLPDQVAAGSSFPYLLSFRRTSMKAGQQLATIMYARNKRAGLPPAATVFSLGGRVVSGDGGEYIVLGVQTERKSSEDELGEAFSWFETVKQGQAKVHEGDDA